MYKPFAGGGGGVWGAFYTGQRGGLGGLITPVNGGVFIRKGLWLILQTDLYTFS